MSSRRCGDRFSSPVVFTDYFWEQMVLSNLEKFFGKSLEKGRCIWKKKEKKDA